jgi:hypothetical protein
VGRFGLEEGRRDRNWELGWIGRGFRGREGELIRKEVQGEVVLKI